MFKRARQRKYIPEDPTTGDKHYPERLERPPKTQHTVEEFLRILEAAPTYLRVAIVLLEQTGNRTYTELLSLEMNRIDFENGLILLGADLGLKAEASAAAQPPQQPGPEGPPLVERPISGGNPLSFFPPSFSRPAHQQHQDRLEEHAQAGWHSALPHLSAQAQARLLHPDGKGCRGCRPHRGHEALQPGNQARISDGHAR